MTVVFSTYQSIDTIAAAQKQGLGRFDLIICDEAHRTTGVTLAGADESAFVRVHNDSYLGGDRRLYMTATPRIYSDETKQEAKDQNAAVASMDDESAVRPGVPPPRVRQGGREGPAHRLQGPDPHHRRGRRRQRRSRRASRAGTSELNLDDAAKIIGCWNALAKRSGTFTDGTELRRRHHADEARRRLRPVHRGLQGHHRQLQRHRRRLRRRR